jgi:hypothetical protein
MKITYDFQKSNLSFDRHISPNLSPGGVDLFLRDIAGNADFHHAVACHAILDHGQKSLLKIRELPIPLYRSFVVPVIVRKSGTSFE